MFVEADGPGFQTSVSPELKVEAGQSVKFDFALTISAVAQSVNVSAGTVENAYRVDNVAAGGPFGTTPILDLPYSVNVISRQLIDDTQSRNFKEAAKYLPLVSFQEMQGPEVLRPETRGMQGSNMQNDRKDGMGIAVTTPSALEEYEQIEVVNGSGWPALWSGQPIGNVQLRDQASHRAADGPNRVGLRGQYCWHRSPRPGRTPFQEDIRLPYELVVGRWRWLRHRERAPASIGRCSGRCASIRPYRNRSQLQLLQLVSAWISRLVCLYAQPRLRPLLPDRRAFCYRRMRPTRLVKATDSLSRAWISLRKSAK